MKSYLKEFLLKKNGKYLFTILLLTTVSVISYSIEKSYSQLEDSQLNGPAITTEKDDKTRHFLKKKTTFEDVRKDNLP